MAQKFPITIAATVIKKNHSELSLLKEGVTYQAELVCGSYKVFYKEDKSIPFSKKKFSKLFDKVNP